MPRVKFVKPRPEKEVFKRPEYLKEMIGNENLIKVIKKKYGTNGTKPKAILFSGKSGTGKTTLARIVAKLSGISSFNLKEFDSTATSGIDFVRSFQQIIPLRPSGEGNKGYLIDECHELTPKAINGLLKPIEEAPDYVYFFLCTTEPEKILKTPLKRRLVNYELEQLSDDYMKQWIKQTLPKLGVPLSEKLINAIIEDSDGSPGQAIGKMKAITGVSNRKEALAILKMSSDENKKSQAIELYKALMERNKWIKIAKIINSFDKTDVEHVRRYVLGCCRNQLLKKDNARAFLIMDSFITPFYDTPIEQLMHACYEALQ